MIDSWTWFRERSDAELGETPEPELDRLSEAIVHADAVSRRRQLAQMIAAGAMVVVSLGLVGVTVSLGAADRVPSSGPGLPVPQEEARAELSSRAATGSPTRLPSPVASVDPSRPATSQRTFRPRVTLTAGRPLPTQTPRASATVPVATTPPPTPPKPSTTTPQPSPSKSGPSSTPTTGPTQTTSSPTPTGGA